MEKLSREATMEPSAIDVAAGTAKLSFSSTISVQRYNPKYGGRAGNFREVLSHEPGDLNNAIFESGKGLVLRNHKTDLVLGDVIPGSLRIGADKKARASIRLYPEHRHLLEEIQSGLAPNSVSVGYTLLSVVKRVENPDGVPTIYFAWQPYEISILTPDHPPADGSVGFGRSKPPMKNSLEEMLALFDGARSAGRNYSRVTLAEVLDPNEQSRAVREVRAARPSRIGGDPILGEFVSFEMLAQRDLTAGTQGAGGYFVGQSLQPFITNLKNRCAVLQLGAKMYTGMEGVVVFPRQTGSTTPKSLSEIAAATESNPTFDQAIASPHRISIKVIVSNQVRKLNPALDQFLVDEFMSAIATRLDYLAYFGGQNASEPTGILGTPGIGSVVFGAAADWSHVLQFEKALSDSNADVGRLGWALSPATRNTWKAKSKISATNYPSFLMENDKVNGYDAAVTNNLSGTNQACFGSWDNLMILVWGDGIEVVQNKFDLDTTGQTRFTANLWCDFVLRHPQCFAVSTDSAAQ